MENNDGERIGEDQYLDIEDELDDLEHERAKEDGKMFGKCEGCGMETVLVEEVGLCGPCCFGEAETLNGNW